MDKGVYLASVLFLLLGIIGIWFSYFSGLSETLSEMGGISILVLILGIMILPIGLLKGGRPTSKELIPIGLTLLLALALIGNPMIFFNKEPVIDETGRTITIHLVSEEWAFNKTNPTIKVQLGDRVHIILFNNGTVPHDFAIPGLSEEKTGIISPQATGELEFIVSKTGNFEYICSIPGHAELGMRGKFIVESPQE
jgi:nitrite reductase (NO-forming)